MSQVDLGKMAEQKAQNPEVKKFAQLMVEEHSKIAEQLKQMGMAEGINLPTSVTRQDAATHRSWPHLRERRSKNPTRSE
jgi:putative membrane protein